MKDRVKRLRSLFLAISLVGSWTAMADLAADSPVVFPKEGALPAQFPPDLSRPLEPGVEEGYYLFRTPERSLQQIAAIQKEMPSGAFSLPATDWSFLRRTHRALEEGGDLHIFALGDSIVNDTMRSGWVGKLQEAYPKARIQGTVLVRGGGGCQHYREDGRLSRYVIPRRPDLVVIGGISQRDIESIRAVILELRRALPDVEFLLATGAFGTADPRDAAALRAAAHSGTGVYGESLRALAMQERCAFLDLTTPWAEYLRSSGQHPHRFYRDPVHANEYGEQVLGKILLQFFRP